MTQEIVYRPAVPSDAAGIAIVQAYTWLTAYAGLLPQRILDLRIDGVPRRAEQMARSIEDGEHFIVALCADAVVGFAVWYPNARSEVFSGDGEIGALYVLKGFQGRGIGAELFRMCRQALAEAGCAHFVVNCLQGNPAAGFYAKMGGSAVGERRDVLSDGTEITEDVFRFSCRINR